MKRWNKTKKEFIENPKIDKFIDEIVKVCQKHKMSISHEDLYGCFTIEKLNKRNISWFNGAADNT